MNALELLRNDHTAVLGLLSDLDKIAADATRKKKMHDAGSSSVSTSS